ncbi:hypothetical protein Dimus_004618 [Dionaea muscipula]
MEEGCCSAADPITHSSSYGGGGGEGGGSGGPASKLLVNLPSRGLFSSTVTASNLGGMRVYVCERDTSPPDHQVIKTDQMNILIRSLTLKKQKGDMKGMPEGSRKRVPEKVADGRASAKRLMTGTQNGTPQEVSDNFQGLTVDRLRVLLREKGLSPRGKKDELIARLRSAMN